MFLEHKPCLKCMKHEKMTEQHAGNSNFILMTQQIKPNMLPIPKASEALSVRDNEW